MHSVESPRAVSHARPTKARRKRKQGHLPPYLPIQNKLIPFSLFQAQREAKTPSSGWSHVVQSTEWLTDTKKEKARASRTASCVYPCDRNFLSFPGIPLQKCSWQTDSQGTTRKRQIMRHTEEQGNPHRYVSTQHGKVSQMP